MWKSIPGYEGLYIINENGEVRNLRPRYFGEKRKPCIGNHGYPLVHLRDKNGIKKGVPIHTLVARAFLGPRPQGMEVRHLDNDKTNPSLGNICYGTRAENIEDRFRNGEGNRGIRHWNCRLAESDVREIRRQLSIGETLQNIADQYGITISNVSCIKLRKSWRHI